MQLKQQVWVAQKEFQVQKESVLTLWCSDKARNPRISQQGFTGSQSLSGSPAISYQLHTARSCLFQYRFRIAGGGKEQKKCSPVFSTWTSICLQQYKEEIVISSPWPTVSLALFFVVSVLSFQDFRNWRNKICLYKVLLPLSLSPPTLKSKGQKQTTCGATTQWTSFWWRQHSYKLWWCRYFFPLD